MNDDIYMYFNIQDHIEEVEMWRSVDNNSCGYEHAIYWLEEILEVTTDKSRYHIAS